MDKAQILDNLAYLVLKIDFLNSFLKEATNVPLLFKMDFEVMQEQIKLIKGAVNGK